MPMRIKEHQKTDISGSIDEIYLPESPKNMDLCYKLAYNFNPNNIYAEVLSFLFTKQDTENPDTCQKTGGEK